MDRQKTLKKVATKPQSVRSTFERFFEIKENAFVYLRAYKPQNVRSTFERFLDSSLRKRFCVPPYDKRFLRTLYL